MHVTEQAQAPGGTPGRQVRGGVAAATVARRTTGTTKGDGDDEEDWDHGDKLNSRCRRAVFVVGTDFGLTRKPALRSVLRWMPKGDGFSLGAASERGFHPKIIAWKTRLGRHYCVVGSSNLSRAAFSENREANIFSSISAADYGRICNWIEDVATIPVTAEWIDHHYEEAKRTVRGNAPRTPIVRFRVLPNSRGCVDAVKRRRAKGRVFEAAKVRLQREMSRCAKRRSVDGDQDFWRFLWPESGKWRFQRGTAITISAKHARWREACGALLGILDASKKSRGRAPSVDRVVREEIDHLARNKNPVRGAWLSEMLCHYFPHLYPVDNDPVRQWLSRNKYSSRRGISEGRYYIELAQKLREIVKETHPAGAGNLAELDGAVRRWVSEHNAYKPKQRAGTG